MGNEKLYNKKCTPCGKVPPFTKKQAEEFLKEVSDWVLIKNTYIEKNFNFKNFKEALAFVNQVGKIAEKEGHHPDVLIYSFKNVKITLWTHSINGLSKNDFVLASKIDRLDG